MENSPTLDSVEKEPVTLDHLGEFDKEYFESLEGPKGWIAIGQSNCQNQRYFTALGPNDEKLGIIGVYDTAEDSNITHTVVDPAYRGQGLAKQFKELIMRNLGLSFITLTINLDNTRSINAARKLPGIKKVNDEKYEQDFHKIKFIYEAPKKNNPPS